VTIDNSSNDFDRMLYLAINDREASTETLIERFKADHGSDGKYARNDYMSRLAQAARATTGLKHHVD
jgi:hypothetical protein